MGYASWLNQTLAKKIVATELSDAEQAQIAEAGSTNAIEKAKDETWTPGLAEWVVAECRHARKPKEEV